MPQLRALLVTPAVLAFALLGCGSSNKNNSGNPDANNQNIDGSVGDGGTDGSGSGTCTTTVTGAQALDQNPGDGTFISWVAPVTTDLGGGGASTISFQFFQVDGDTLTGAIDLTAGDQDNNGTCAACVLVFDNDATGTAVKTFFQSGGTMTLTADPLATSHLSGSIANLSLVEVTLDSQTGASTLVPGGVCLSVGSVTLSADDVPADWTCAHSAFGDGVNCDCNCGDVDPDCAIAGAPVVGCTGTQVCSQAVCTDTCTVTPPTACPVATDTCGYSGDGTTDICYTDPTVVDPALIGATCTSATALFCAVTNTDAAGVCDQFIGDDEVCRKACNANTQCTAATEVCSPLFATGTEGICVPKPPANDKCSAAQAVTIGGTAITGNSAFASNNYSDGLDAATCTGFPQEGPDLVYKVTLTAAQAITITLATTDANFDPSLSVLGPGTAAAVCGDPADTTAVTCDAGADANAAGMGETLPFTATTAGTYFIIVDTFQAPGGAFTLTVTSP